jgi:hypothetical protein
VQLISLSVARPRQSLRKPLQAKGFVNNFNGTSVAIIIKVNVCKQRFLRPFAQA